MKKGIFKNIFHIHDWKYSSTDHDYLQRICTECEKHQFKVFNRWTNFPKTNVTASFWFMRDNHTFIKLTGTTITEIKNKAILTSRENPYGMVCPVIILEGDKEIKRVGSCCHVDGNGNVDLSGWEKDVKKENIISILND